MENISVYLSDGGSFTCPNCNNKSKVSKLPTIPGVYKITCYKCKHQVIHKVEKVPALEKESTKEKFQNSSLPPQNPSKNFKRQNTDIFPNIPNLPEAKKPFIEVNKVKIPDPIKENNTTKYRC
ncbi:MAG: hypothetical protein EBS19_02860 [Spirochaetia bacterium]|nr:hypothetical protein [Spirochaetia bacterium]